MMPADATEGNFQKQLSVQAKGGMMVGSHELANSGTHFNYLKGGAPHSFQSDAHPEISQRAHQ